MKTNWKTKKNLASGKDKEKADTIMPLTTAPTGGSQLLEIVIEQKNLLIDKAKRIEVVINPAVDDSYYNYTCGQHINPMIHPIKYNFGTIHVKWQYQVPLDYSDKGLPRFHVKLENYKLIES